MIIHSNKLTSIQIDEEKGTMKINWYTGEEGATNGVTLKVEVLETHKSDYIASCIDWDPNYKELF